MHALYYILCMHDTQISSRYCMVRSVFYNLKSQNFKMSVSNPKSKYVVYLSVLSQISNCQSLGRKNKREILKTDRAINYHYY